eukprot:782293-Pelagomonas_calceolata.AAC.1
MGTEIALVFFFLLEMAGEIGMGFRGAWNLRNCSRLAIMTRCPQFSPRHSVAGRWLPPCAPLRGTRSNKHQGPSQQPKITYNVASKLPTHLLPQFGPEQGLSQNCHLPGVMEKCKH